MAIAFSLGRRTRSFAAAVLCVILVAVVLAQAYRMQHAREKRQIIADLNAIPPISGSYALETNTASAAHTDEAWKAFCYREREILIAEAHASSH
jgi:hypothetical protein